MLALALFLAVFAGLLIPKLSTDRDAHKQEQVAMSHPALALIPAGTVVGNESE